MMMDECSRVEQQSLPMPTVVSATRYREEGAQVRVQPSMVRSNGSAPHPLVVKRSVGVLQLAHSVRDFCGAPSWRPWPLRESVRSLRIQLQKRDG